MDWLKTGLKCAWCSVWRRVDRSTLHIGAVAFPQNFDSSLNEHLNFHVCVVDVVFEVAADETQTDQATPPNTIFHPATGINEAGVACW